MANGSGSRPFSSGAWLLGAMAVGLGVFLSRLWPDLRRGDWIGVVLTVLIFGIPGLIWWVHRLRA